MNTNIDKYKNDLDKLIEKGVLLSFAMLSECSPPDEFEKQFKEAFGVEFLDYKDKIPNFKMEYQSWYSEALLCVKQLLPDRLKDFTELYKPTIKRTKISCENYTIFDYLQGLQMKNPFAEVIVKKDAAIPKFCQQLLIVVSIKKRFESSSFQTYK